MHGVAHSKGRAEVVYSRQTDAEAAMKKYNNFKFCGKYMKVKIIGHFYNRRFSNHATYRPVPYAPPKIQAPDAVRGHGLIADQAAPSTTSSAIETEAKLFISHLDHEISYKDIEGKTCTWIHSDIMDDNVYMEPSTDSASDSSCTDGDPNTLGCL